MGLRRRVGNPRCPRGRHRAPSRRAAAGYWGAPGDGPGARESDDYAALALLLARAEESRTAAGPRQGEQRHENEDLLDRDGGEFLDTTTIIEEALDPQTAAEVLAAEALPALEAELARAAGRGHDPVEVLSQVAAQRSLSDAVDPAAVLHYRLQRHLHLESDPITSPAAGGEDGWWLLDEATRDDTGAAHDRADADAQRWAEHAAGGVASDQESDPLTRDSAQTVAEGHRAEADRLDEDASALTVRAQEATVAAASAARGPQVGLEPGFTGGSPTARLVAESYPHSIRTALARSNQPQRTPMARGRRAGQHAEHDRDR